MFNKQLKFQILFLVLVTLLIGMFALYQMSANEIKKTIDKQQLNFYSENIDTILHSLESRYQKLQKTNLVQSYEYSFKEFSINELKKIHYAKTTKVYPFIINDKGVLILHPTLDESNFDDYSNDEEYRKIVKAKEDDFNITVQGIEKWVVFKHYKNWDWIVGYSMPLSIKYEALIDFRNKFLMLTLFIVSIISLFIVFIVRHVLSPIEKLITASKRIAEGDLESDIKINGSYELTQLSNSFSIMKNKIKINIDELEQKVEERTLKLTQSNSELEQIISDLKQTQDKLIEAEKMASLGGLVAGVAHEMNTPIGVSLTGVTYLIEINKEIRKKYEDNEMVKSEFEYYLQQSNDCAELINRNIERTANLITSFKQVAVDQTSEERRSFELIAYLNKIIFSLNGLIKNNNIDISVISNEVVYIDSYPGAYAQIFTNLIINSVTHGFGKSKNGEISIKVSIENKYINVIYKDNGKGIEEDNLKRIFEPFYTTNRTKGGTGLGLNIIYNIITGTLKGTINCSSTIDNGVTFLIKIPLQE